MNRAVDARGWDGEWYLTAIDDEGRDVGSHANEEGKIFLIPQLWAVLADLDDKARVKTAMESANRLLEAPLGTRVSWPAYTHIDNRIGSVTQKSAGVHENGGVYLHTMAWRLAVDALLGDEARVERDIRQMLPWDQTYAPTEGEPYVLFNSYFGDQTGYRYATPGQSWRTASTQWFVKAMTLYVLGLQPDVDGLHIHPCLPENWNECAAVKRLRGCEYRVTYTRTGAFSVTADGERIPDGGALPLKPGYTVHVKVTV